MQRNGVGLRSWFFFYFYINFLFVYFPYSSYVLGLELVTFFTCYIGTLGGLYYLGFFFFLGLMLGSLGSFYVSSFPSTLSPIAIPAALSGSNG